VKKGVRVELRIASAASPTTIYRSKLSTVSRPSSLVYGQNIEKGLKYGAVTGAALWIPKAFYSRHDIARAAVATVSAWKE